MNSNFRKLEKELRSYAKRCKDIKYTGGLLLTFLITGMLLPASGVTEKSIERQKKSINNSISDMRTAFKKAKEENNRLLKKANLELIQLMEQGDQVVKSPWSSWQFGMNYFYSSHSGTYKGRGDKKEKYLYEGIFTRDSGADEMNRYAMGNSLAYISKSTNTNSASTTSRQGLNRGYGIESAGTVSKAPVSVQLNASISPRDVGKQSPSSLPQAPSIVLPSFEPRLITPPVAPPAVTVSTPSLLSPPDINFKGKGFGQGARIGMPKGNIIIQNYDSYDVEDRNNSAVKGILNIEVGNLSGGVKTRWWGSNSDGTPNSDIQMKAVTNVPNTSTPGITVGGFNPAGAGTFYLGDGTSTSGLNAFINELRDHNAVISGNYVMTNRGGENNTGRNTIFLSHNPAGVGGGRGATGGTPGGPYDGQAQALEKTATFNGNLTIHGTSTPFLGSTSHSDVTIAVEHQLWSRRAANDWITEGAYSTFLNTGNIKLESGYNMVGILIDVEAWGNDTPADNSGVPHKTKNEGKIILGENSGNSIGIDYGEYSNLAIKSELTVGDIIVGGSKNYGLRMANIFPGNAAYFDKGITILSGGPNKKILVQGKENVGVSIAKYLSSAADLNPIANITGLNVEVDGEKNVGFLRHKTYANNPGDMIFNSTTMGTFSFGDNASDSTLIRTDKYSIDLQKDISVSKGKTGNSFAQAVDQGTGTASEIKNNAVLTSNGLSSFSGIISTGANAKITNAGTVEISGNGNKNLGMVALNGSNLSNSGTVKVTGTGKEKVAIYNDGNIATISNGSVIEIEGESSTGLYNKKTTNIGGTSAIKASKGSTGIFSDAGTVTSTSGQNLTISVDDTGSSKKGLGVYITGNSQVTLDGSRINVKDGAAGVASTGTASNLNLVGSELEYTGEGYAVYTSNGGKINLTNGKLVLSGKAVGYEKDLSVLTPSINTTGMTVHVKSKDVIIMNLRNATNLDLSSLSTTINTWAGLTPGSVTYDPGAENYRMAAIDGLTSYNIDLNLDKQEVAAGTAGLNESMFVKNLAVQRAKVNVLSGNNVTAHLNTAEMTALEDTSVVGLAMNSSSSAVNNSETQINIRSGASVSADRTDAGAGATGLFINYGEANIDAGGKLSVERHTANGANDTGVGIYAVNGSAVSSSGEISVGGNKSIGILGISYRKDASGSLVINEFGPGAAGQGNVSVNTQSGSRIDMDGEEAVGIYVENNDTSLHSVTGANAGTIEMSGKKAVGMAAKNFTGLTNTGTINITADQGVGMFGAVSGVLVNSSTGTVTVGDSTSDSVIRIGMFTEDDGVNILNDGKINAGKNSYGIFGKDVKLGGSSVTNIGDNGVGVFSRASTANPLGNVQIQAGASLNIGENEAVGVFTENTSGGIVVEDLGSNMNIGKGSYGYVLKGTGTTFRNVNSGTRTLNDSSVYLYSTDTGASIVNNADLTSTGNSTYGLYSAGDVTNNAVINFKTGIGNVGMYHTGGGVSGAVNNGTITVGESDPLTDRYSIGMAAGYNGSGTRPAFSGNITNNGTINVEGAASIGMYATNGSTATNGSLGTINLVSDGSVGMYLDKGAVGRNYGTIMTVGAPVGVVGISVKDNADFENHGTIIINSAGGIAAFVDGGRVNLKNYGTVILGNGAVEESSPTVSPTAVTAGGVSIDSPNGPATSPAVIRKDGVEVPAVHFTVPEGNRNIMTSGFAMYVDTLRGTNPVRGLSSLGNTTMDLIIGTDITEVTNSKYIQISGGIIDPYIQTMRANPQITDWNIYPASLTWLATVTRANNGAGDIENIYLAKIPYTNWAGNDPTPVESRDTYNFADGLEQRYGVEEIGTREKTLFNKLNGIGNNEEILLYQAFDEMMGHQYANTQQRVNATGNILDKEFGHLRNDWSNPSKESNKIKVFGSREEYSTDTAGIIDYKSKSYGVAYVHEDETIKLGNSSGWYAGYVQNRFRFKDIGNSKETQNMLKAGIYRTKAFDDNGSLKWTVSGEGFAGQNDMHRRYLVVDEIFQARGSYNVYGVGIRNELSREFRVGERTSIKPYGSLDLEYGRVDSIKEKDGEIRLEVKGNDYFSVKPEVGVEFRYRKPMAVRTNLTASLGVAYENELGKVADVKNKARVRYTEADWFNIRGEKEDRRGNFKADFKLGIENTRFGVTFNAGYDTKGENVRAGIGLRAIY